MEFYVLWAILLVLQNAAFTWVSRARNSGSDLYHGIAAVFSNGIWLVATFFTFDKVFYAAITDGFTLEVGGASLLYVACTVSGSVYIGNYIGNYIGKFPRRFVERGKRQVGHYDDKEQRIVQLEDQVRLVARILERQVSGGVDRTALIQRLDELRAGKATGTETEAEA